MFGNVWLLAFVTVDIIQAVVTLQWKMASVAVLRVSRLFWNREYS